MDRTTVTSQWQRIPGLFLIGVPVDKRVSGFESLFLEIHGFLGNDRSLNRCGLIPIESCDTMGGPSMTWGRQWREHT